MRIVLTIVTIALLFILCWFRVCFDQWMTFWTGLATIGIILVAIWRSEESETGAEENCDTWPIDT